MTNFLSNLIIEDEDFEWSYSRLKKYEDCKYSWFLKYLCEVDTEDRFFSSFGTFVHSIYNDVINRQYSPNLASVKYLSDFNISVFGRPSSNKTFNSYFRTGLKAMRKMPSFIDEISEYEIIGSEVEFSIKHKNKNIIGFIDLVLKDKSDGKYIIVDHKSKKLKKGKRGSKSSKELDASLRQLYLYSEYIKQEYGEYPKELWFNSFRLDENNLIKQAFYKEKFDETMEWMEKTIQEISKNEEWTPTCDYFYCKYLCDCSSECEYYEMMRG